MRTRKAWFLLLILLQALALLGWAGSAYAVVWFGKELRLETAPVDPRDFLYGDYVILYYEMNRLSPSLWRGEQLPEEGDAIYVALERRDGFDVPAAAYPSRSAAPAGQTVVKGIVDYQWEQEIVVRYGLERYYVPEGTGTEWERQAAQGSLVVTAKAASWGQAVLTDVQTVK